MTNINGFTADLNTTYMIYIQSNNGPRRAAMGQKREDGLWAVIGNCDGRTMYSPLEVDIVAPYTPDVIVATAGHILESEGYRCLAGEVFAAADEMAEPEPDDHETLVNLLAHALKDLDDTRVQGSSEFTFDEDPDRDEYLADARQIIESGVVDAYL